ncbi:hypothetical protein PanWU01x14_070050 [Parasponia andersonii]|uniref:Uncharacterized protein n=1 Tax=Parasponia andersonii TaxID=3476 RepID=A0A2P5DEV0_PARAD|nr:hypothetical protein PanWU01x14_070050 [Parasponia andersonii]
MMYNFSTVQVQHWFVDSHAYYKRAYYWLIDNLFNMVLSFDVDREVFHGIPLLIDLQRNRDSEYVMDVNYDILEVVVMKRRDCAIIEPLKVVVLPLIFWNSDELLINIENSLMICGQKEIVKTLTRNLTYQILLLKTQFNLKNLP